MRILLLPALLLLAGAAQAQGDDCSAPLPLSLGSNPFDLTGFSDSLYYDGACASHDGFEDIWFTYTPATSDVHVFETCGSDFDTIIRVFDGSACGGICIAGNDDACAMSNGINYASSLTVGLTAGQSYLVQIETWDQGVVGLSDLQISIDAPVVNPNNGHAYYVVNQATDWDTAKAAAEALTFGSFTGHLVTIQDQAELDWIMGNLNVTRPWIGLYQNTASSSYSEPTGGWEWVTGEPFTFDNWAAGEPNDNPAGENTAEMFGNGEWNDIQSFNAWTNSYIVEFDGGGGPALFCSPANPNSTGNPVTLASSDQSGAGVYHLEAEGGPFDQFGIFLVAAANIPSGIPVSDGLLCLSAPIGRYTTTAGPGLNSIGKFDAAGVFQNLAGTSTVGSGFDVLAVLPTPPGGVIVSGATWNFQLWYRDVGGASNFSDGISVTF